ncbi:MAG: stage V sporulation protein S [Caldilineaceae bacterium]|nr:stage V sporulation protein S [Caldilineaceae bacterium]
MQPNEPPLIRVATNSVPNLVAGAIAGVAREFGYAEVQAIGAGAVNQAVKSIAIANAYMAGERRDLSTQIRYNTVSIGDTQRTALRFHIRAQSPPIIALAAD